MCLCHCAKDRIVSADARPIFLVGRFRVADGVELGSRGQHRATEPNSIALHIVRHDLRLDGLRIQPTLAQLVTHLHSIADDTLNVTLQAPIKVLEHGRPTREDNVLLKSKKALSYMIGKISITNLV